MRFGTVGNPQTALKRDSLTAIEHMCALGMHHLEMAWVQSVSVSDEMCAQLNPPRRAGTAQRQSQGFALGRVVGTAPERFRTAILKPELPSP